jgi:hypothetical protein
MKYRISWSAESASGIADKEKPPRQDPGGTKDLFRWPSPLERVTALPVLDLGGCDGQSHLPAQDARDKSSDRVSLPAGGFHEILSGGASGAPQQVKELGALGAVSGTDRLLGRPGRLRAPVGLLRSGSLGGRLTLGRRDVPPVCGNPRPFGGSWSPGWDAGLIVYCFFRNNVHSVFSFSGDYRDDHISHSGSPQLQADSGRNLHGSRVCETVELGFQIGAEGARC